MRSLLAGRRVWIAVFLVALLAVPASVAAYVRARDANRRLQLAEFLADPLAGDDGWVAMPWLAEESDEEERGDDARRRQIATHIMWGEKTPEASAELGRIARAEYEKWWPLFHGGAPNPEGTPTPLPVVGGQSWVNLGPTDANFQWNGGNYPGVDSGRVSGISVNPADPTDVIIGTSGGGLWKTSNFGAANPTWTPIGEALPNLAIGAIERDPSSASTLYVGLGDFVDTPGGQMVKSTNKGATWSAPIQLSGTYPAAAGGLAVIAQRIRWVEVDPNNAGIVLVATDAGLFRSTNAGTTYALVDLPNAGGAAAQRPENVWTIQYTGQAGGVSRWVASGVTACTPALRPPRTGSGVLPGVNVPGINPPVVCTLGNIGDIWVSTDAGATWTSRRSSSTFPAPEPATPVGRITLAAGTPVGTVTTIYAQLSRADELTSSGAGYWRSLDSGMTWTQVAAPTGAVTNPTRAVAGQRDCPDVNVVNAQSWYNAALWVDPGDDNVFVAGGMLCGMRTRNGKAATPTFNLISHWLPAVSGGDTADGTLPYVHADWHRVVIVRVGATARVLAGVDGGLYWSDNTLSVTLPETGAWSFANRGLPTHLSYSVASGDPVTGNPFVAFTGLQDNGTRFRNSGAAPTTFNQVVGGDGFGAAAGRDPASGATIYWAGVNGRHVTCTPAAGNSQCNLGGAWTTRDPTPLGGCTVQADGQPFITRYAPVPANPAVNTFITITNRAVHRVSGAGAWAAVSPCLIDAGGTVLVNRNVGASQNIDGFYGVAGNGGRFAVTSNCQGTTTACTWTVSNRLWFDSAAFGGNGDGVRQPLESMSFTSMVAFPPGNTGQPVGNVYLGATTAPLMDDFSRNVPASLGRLFRTTDRGTTWTPFHGNGTGQDLPNVGVGVVRYDPADLNNNTIYAGTELGVYRTTDGGNTWQRYGVGLPAAWVTDMFIGRTGAILRVATFGRGLWEIYPTATSEKGVNGNGDWDRNLQLDWVDLGAMASRLGTNPSTTTVPLYDWNDDMTGTTNGIDENDLTTLTFRFGNAP